MEEHHDQELKELADKVALSIISEACHHNKGRIYKDMFKRTPFSMKFITDLPEEWGKEYAEENPERFQYMLEVTMKHKLRWYNLEGFTKEMRDHYVFYTTQEIEEMIDELYNA